MLIVLFCVQLLACTVISQQTCYAENGDIVASSDTPCGDSHGVHCCGDSAYCLSNGLCQTSGESAGYYQGTCTDPTYESALCSSICRGSDEGATFQYGLAVDSCGTNNTFCCEYPAGTPGGVNCCGGDAVKQLANYSTLYLIGNGTATPFSGSQTQSTPNAKSPTSTASSIPLTTSPTSTISSTNTLSSPASTNSPSSNTIPLSAAASTATAISTPSSSHSNTIAIALGISLGLFAGLVFGGLATFCFVRRRNRRRKMAASPPTQDTPNAFGTVPESRAFYDGAPRKSELPGEGHQLLRELDGHVVSGELQGEGHPRYELPDGKASKSNWR